MTTKTGFLVDGGQIWMKLWDQICQCGCKIQHHYSQCIGSRKVRKNWWRQLWIACLALGYVASISAFWYLSSYAFEKRKETLASMCDERARMLQDQINVGMNHIQAMSVMISIFHHGKNPSAIDQQNYCEDLLVWLENLQRTFARYTERTSFERPLTSGVAYAVRVLHSGREQFEIEQGWTIKRMDEQTPVHEDEYDPDGRNCLNSLPANKLS